MHSNHCSLLSTPLCLVGIFLLSTALSMPACVPVQLTTQWEFGEIWGSFPQAGCQSSRQQRWGKVERAPSYASPVSAVAWIPHAALEGVMLQSQQTGLW